MKLGKFIIFAFLITLACEASAQKINDKPYNKWSKDESIKIVTDSPWAKTYQSNEASSAASQRLVGREQSQSVNSGGSNPGSVARYLGPSPVAIRLFSAMPVRQALIRIQQIDAGYDKMKEVEKTSFDAGRAKFLECNICKDYYVVTLVKFPDSSGQSVEEGLFQGMTLDELKGNVKLVNDPGDEREF